MMAFRFLRLIVFTLSLLMAVTAVFAQAEPEGKQYKPSISQPGKDVVWVPTPQELVDKMLDMAKVTPQDYVVDLGSGDGRMVISAAKRGARALGVEYNPDMVALSKGNAAKEGVTAKAQFIQGDLFETDFSQVTVLTMFLLPDINIKLRPRILNLKPGTRVVSNTFDMGEWPADNTAEVEEVEKCNSYCKGYLWIVPAKVGGIWRLSQGELTLMQNFQMLSGTLNNGTENTAITNGRLNADQISFTVGTTKYTGRVSGDDMEGVFTSGGNTDKWKATRIGRVAQAPSK